MCKTCCEGRGQGCSSSKHRSGPPGKKVVNTFSPSRPPPVSLPFPTTAYPSTTPMLDFTTDCPSGSVLASEFHPTARSFPEDMPDEWAREWNEREAEARDGRAQKKKRAGYCSPGRHPTMARRMCSLCLVPPFRFQIICVFNNGSPPTTIHQQNILAYPTLNITQCPSLMTKMTTNAGAVVEIWNPSVKQWGQEDIHGRPRWK